MPGTTSIWPAGASTAGAVSRMMCMTLTAVSRTRPATMRAMPAQASRRPRAVGLGASLIPRSARRPASARKYPMDMSKTKKITATAGMGWSSVLMPARARRLALPCSRQL